MDEDPLSRELRGRGSFASTCDDEGDADGTHFCFSCAAIHDWVASDDRVGKGSCMDNVEVVRAIEAAYNRKDYAALDGLIAADLSAHTPGSEIMPAGLEGAKMADM
ncbi:MAG: hypothetical protein L3K06_06150, partial [Thermoplasmata archaeon]|nr:hypothetical protein [Thermoplasmata archaeon]